jgi:antitoxin component YwqK of YwqJK toxin-antitoxin module
MNCARLTIFVLLPVFVAGCGRHAGPVSVAPSASHVEVVEEYWPNGGLKLRKHVLRREDGTRVDHGSFERWHTNGIKEYEVVFVLGEKDGTEFRYHRNGRVWTRCEYRDGKRNGSSITWDDSGAMVKQEEWADGQPHGTWIVWEDGSVKWSNTFEHGDPAP